MIRHHYTLEHIAREVAARYCGAVLVEAWTQEKYTVAMVFAVNDELRTIMIDTTPDGGSISEQPQLRRARSNTRDVFRPLWNTPLALVTKHPDDRVISLWFSDHQVHCEFFSSGNGNVVCVRDGMILEALRDTSERCDTTFSVNAPSSIPLWEQQNLTAQQALARSPLQLGPWYAEEVCRRAGVDPSTHVSDLSPTQRDQCSTIAEQVRTTCLSTRSFYVLTRGDARLLSLCELQSWTASETLSSALEATTYLLRERYRIEHLRSKRATALRTLTNDVQRAQRTLAALNSDGVRDARSERYRMWADTLLSYPQQHERDRTTITLVGPNGDDISIPLNPAHSIIENATRLYDKARSAETAALHREQRIPELQRKINELEERIAKIEQADTIRDIEVSSPQRMNTQTHDPRDEAGGRFRVFVIDEQHTLYVGKSAANNDELTMRFAKQNDWWLHARGSAGSHAVLRGVDADRIPKPVLEKAAAITAYYSQARNASWVSVVYTQRKNVRKPKGANVGAVVLEREQTVMVKPSIPS